MNDTSRSDWYILYTLPNLENKVVSFLNKKAVVNFCPFINTNEWDMYGNKKTSKPLFPSYVFVLVQFSELEKLKNTPGVINVAYRLSEPAIIYPREIALMQDCIRQYKNVIVSKTSIRHNNSFDLSVSKFEREGENIQIELPSLGYMLSAKKKEEKHLHSISNQPMYQHAG